MWIFDESFNEQLHNLYNSPGINMAIKSKMMGWAERVARMLRMINACNILVGLP
jgi:hypothetical protein